MKDAHADQATVEYFDSHAHHYSRKRIKGVADLIRDKVTSESSLCDVGAGGGETLGRLAKALDLQNLTAMDVSAASLKRAQERLPQAQTAVVSILDDQALAPWTGKFDVVLMAAVLHHLVAPTRRRSLADAQRGLRNAYSLAKPGGLVVVLEPVFHPRAASSALFWVKRSVVRFTDSRIPVFGYWNNIGAPVVSFYTTEQVREMVTSVGGRIVAENSEVEKLGYADHIVEKANLAIVAERPAI